MAGCEQAAHHFPRNWFDSRRFNILLEEQNPSKKMAARQSRCGVLDVAQWDDSTVSSLSAEIQPEHNRDSYQAKRIRMRLDLRTLRLEGGRRTEGRNSIRDPRLRFVDH